MYRTAVLGENWEDDPGRTIDQERLDDGSDRLDEREHLMSESTSGNEEDR